MSWLWWLMVMRDLGLVFNINLDPFGYSIGIVTIVVAIFASYFAKEAAHFTKKTFENDVNPFLRAQISDIESSQDPGDQSLYRAKLRKDNHVNETAYNNVAKFSSEKGYLENSDVDAKQEYELSQKLADHFEQSTNLIIVNEGKGAANNVKLQIYYENEPRHIFETKHITAIGPGKGTRVAFQQKQIEPVKLVPHDPIKGHLIVVINFSDLNDSKIEGGNDETDCRWWKVVCTGNPHYNDGFQLGAKKRISGPEF